MSQTEFFLGIDLGSSSVKTTLFSPNEGRVVDSYSFPEILLKFDMDITLLV